MTNKLILGVDVGGTNTKVGLVRSDGTLLDKRIISTPTAPGPGATAALIAQTYHELLKRTGQRRAAFCGAGIPGPLSNDRTRLLATPNLGSWSHAPIKKILEKHLGLSVCVENDANVAMWGEYWLGAARHHDSCLMLTLGTGIGGGMILNGNLWTGPFGGAAELGHVIVIPGGRLCGCGNRGCLEAYASARGMLGAYRSEMPKRLRSKSVSVTVKGIFDAARGGDRAARRVVDSAIQALAIAITGFIHAIQPRLVVLGGGIAQAGNILMKPLIHRVKSTVLSSHRPYVRIVRARLGSDAGFLGAAGWAFKKYSNQ